MANAKNRKLSKGQKECLRLVLAHLNSKEIGRELDISPHTVDQRLRGAMRTLDTSTRFEAARKFAELEGEKTYQPLIHQPSDIEKFEDSGSLRASVKRETDDRQDAIDGISKVGGSSAALSLEEPTIADGRLPFPRYRGERNALNAAERLSWIIVIAFGSALSFGGILAGLEALSRLWG